MFSRAPSGIQCAWGSVFSETDLSPAAFMAVQAAEKLKFLSFRGTLRAEESLILLTLEPREIPHFVRNDKTAYFFRSLFTRRAGSDRMSSLPCFALLLRGNRTVRH
jgi:hypothetical protein